LQFVFSPVQLWRGSDREALAGTWHPARINHDKLKMSMYYQHSSPSKSKTQQCLRRILTVSQPTPGQSNCTLLAPKQGRLNKKRIKTYREKAY